MALTPEEIIKYTAYLNSAEAAFHSLMTGTQAVEFTDQNGEKIRYTAANRATLASYIAYLRDLLGLSPLSTPNRPAGVIF